MHLLALSLQRATAINVAVYGNFCGPKSQDIVVARGNTIELLRPDETGKLLSVCVSPVFAVVRSLLPFRLAGANRDYLVVGSDSGKISILEFDVQVGEWKVQHCETFGKTGCRRIVPGQYLAADPKGRAIVVAAVEKQRFVYVMNRDSANRLTISSPLEAHKTEAICFSVVGLDVGFDNPIFAMIELEYTEADQDPTGEAAAEADKKLSFYELDLGLNHVVRKWSEPIARTANFLLTVPGGDDGPSGVLICGENWVGYKNQGHPEVRTALPRRADLPADRGLLVTTGTLHRQKDMFFFLLQSELGDLYKVTLETDPENIKVVTNVIVTVFDSVPVANSLCITKTGLLFAASEFSNHALYQFQGIGDSQTAVRAERLPDELNEQLGDDSVSAASVAPLFRASDKLKNLLVTDDISSLAPITDMLIGDLSTSGEDSVQIHALCGRGNRSSLRVLRHGASVTEMAVSELPGRPMAVWSVRTSNDPDSPESQFDRYIVVSFNNATLVLSIGENIEVATDSGFTTTAPTQQVVLLADNALLQVHNYGIRHIRPDKRTTEWKSPGRRQIERAAVNSRQVALSLEGGDIIYFELDATGQLLEMGTVNIDKEVCSLDLGLVPEGRVRSSFLAVGCWDNTVQLLSLDPSDILSQRAAMSVPSRPESLCLIQMANDRGSGSASSGGKQPNAAVSATTTTLYLNVGLDNGVLIRVAVDPVAGSFSDSRQRFLGSKAIKLTRVTVRGQQALVALTTRPWLMYNFQGRYFQAPISYEMLEHVSSFSSEVCAEGMVAVAGNTLRIITVDNLGEMFNQTSFPLRYTPRKMQRFPGTGDLVIIETEHNTYNESEQQQIAAEVATRFPEAADTKMDVGGEEEDEEEEGTRVVIRGPLPPAEGKWASCVRVLEPATGTVKEVLELQGNEAALTMCVCRFAQHSEESFVIVGTAKNLQLHTRQHTGCAIHVFRVLDGKLQHLHETELEDIPNCMSEFQGRLLVGVGKTLRMYDLGKRKLLRKCENRLFPNCVVRLHCIPGSDRIYVGDVSESVHYVKYKRAENALVIFADDTMPRYVSSLCALDYDTVAIADKFGNVSVLRVPEHTNDDVDNPSGARVMWEQGVLNGAPNKVFQVSQYHLGEAVTSLSKCAFIPGGEEVLVASTITGGIFAFRPLRSKGDASFFQHLEMFMRQEYPNLCQRDHLSYRSYFQPTKDTIDGDLCERFGALSYAKQKEFADNVDRTPLEVLKKLEDTRNIL